MVLTFNLTFVTIFLCWKIVRSFSAFFLSLAEFSTPQNSFGPPFFLSYPPVKIGFNCPFVTDLLIIWREKEVHFSCSDILITRISFQFAIFIEGEHQDLWDLGLKKSKCRDEEERTNISVEKLVSRGNERDAIISYHKQQEYPWISSCFVCIIAFRHY